HHAVEPRAEPQLGQRVPYVLGRSRSRHRDRDAPRVQALEQAVEAGEGDQAAARQLAVEPLLLVGEPPQLLVGELASEEPRDDAGMPLPDLGPKDFRLRVDGKVVPLESAYWVAATQKEPEPEAPPEGATTEAYVVTPEPLEGEAAPGRLIVFFFQKDFDESRL